MRRFERWLALTVLAALLTLIGALTWAFFFAPPAVG
jgi:hypothetical protein